MSSHRGHLTKGRIENEAKSRIRAGRERLSNPTRPIAPANHHTTCGSAHVLGSMNGVPGKSDSEWASVSGKEESILALVKTPSSLPRPSAADWKSWVFTSPVTRKRSPTEKESGFFVPME